MDDFLKGCKVESKGYGVIYKLPMQDKDLDVVAKAFYAYICSFAGSGDTAFPGMDKICSDLGVSRQRLERHRKVLIEKGYITINQIKEKGRFSRNEYKINKELTPLLQKPTTEKPTTEKPTTDFNTINNNSLNNNNNNNNNNNSLSVDKSTDGIGLVVNKIKELKNLPQPKEITTTRRGHIKARIDKYGIEEVLDSLEYFNNTNLVKNAIKERKEKINKHGWLDFDWIFNPNNFVKIAERKYIVTEEQKGITMEDIFG